MLLAQPAYDESSDITHAITRQRDPVSDSHTCSFRYTNFVENGVALLAHTALKAVVGALAVSPSGRK